MANQQIDIQAVVNNAIETALQSRGIANILIAGKTGVGKSTLINAVFQGRMVETGQGKPITQNTRKITKEGIPVSIYDTKGLEINDYRPILDELLGIIKQQNCNLDPHTHIHVAWLCIAESSRRVEDAEINLIKELSKVVPVIIIITTAVADNGFKAVVQDLLPDARNVVRVNSFAQTFDGGITIPVHGLEDLVSLTMEVLPEGQKNAFAAAQRISLQQKVNQAHRVVTKAASAAASAAAIPLPFSDAVAIVPIQIAMLASISVSFGLDVNNRFLGTLVSGIFSSLVGTLGGRAMVGSLLKLFPAIGSVVGGIISATVATSLTVAFGQAYILTLHTLLKDDPTRLLSPSDVADAFRHNLNG